MKWRVLSALAVLALAPLAALAQQQEGLITGKVTSDAGAPIAGAQVYVEKMNIGTTTKEDGTYRFVIPAARATGQQASLSVKLIGFKPKSVLIALKQGEQTVDFVLSAQAVVLQQVVITGEGIITTNEKLGETVNTVSGDRGERRERVERDQRARREGAERAGPVDVRRPGLEHVDPDPRRQVVLRHRPAAVRRGRRAARQFDAERRRPAVRFRRRTSRASSPRTASRTSIRTTSSR